MTSVEKRRSGRKSGGHRKHSDGGYSDTSSAGSFLDETDREVSNLTDRAFRSLCIGDEAVYNDSDLGSFSPCIQRDRQLAFSHSGLDREDREREELKRAAHESFSLRMQQYGQDWTHEGMYGAEIQRDPQWEVYGERTQGRVSATFQHSFVETCQQEESPGEEQLSFLSNGATESSSQQRRSRSRVSSLIRAFNSEGQRDGGMDGKLREWNDETSWDKSALMSIQRELSEFSYQQQYNSGHFPSAGSFSSQDTNIYSNEVANMNSASSFMRPSHSKHSMSTQVNCNSNFFIHSEFSPFKIWRDYNRFPFQQGDVSGFMHCSEFPKWYDTPMYRELSLEAQPQGPYRFEERGIRYPGNNMPPVVPPSLPRSTSTSTMLQKASAVEKRCESELTGHYPHRKRTQSLGTNRLPSQRPSTASPTSEMSRRVRDTISSVKALQQKIKMMTEQNITANQSISDNFIPFNDAKTAAPNVISNNTNISQRLTPSETSEVRQYAGSPQPVEHPPVRAESRGATPDVRMSSYKSRATSLLFNLKDNRKRVKSTYSPAKFKGTETLEKNKQASIQEPRDTVIDMPDFPDLDYQFLQVEDSSRTNAASHQYGNQYHNPGLSLTTGQYSQYTSSDYQTAHHPGFTGFMHENYAGNQSTNGQNLHADLSSFTPYNQAVIDHVETPGGDAYRLKPSYTATETPRLNADNNQLREYLISKANAEQHFNETVGREFTKADRYQQLKHNKHDYSNVSSQDGWRQANSQDAENLSLKAVSPWKQEINALMEKDQHAQAYQRAATTKEERNPPRDKYRENINTELEKIQLRESFGVGVGLVNPHISNQHPQNAPFTNETIETPAYYGQQQPGLQTYHGHNTGNEMKDNYLTQNYNNYTDQEYRNQHTYSNIDKNRQETGQRKQYTPIPKGYEMQPMFEQKNPLSNHDGVSAPVMVNQVKDRQFVEAEQATAEHIKVKHTQPELAESQHWAQVEQPRAESARLILARQAGSEKVRAEEAKDEATEHERANQGKAEQIKQTEKPAEQTREERTKAEQTRVQKVTEEPRHISEEVGVKQVKAEAERLKEEHIKTEQARLEQAKTDQARGEGFKAEQTEQDQVRRERMEAEQIRTQKVKAEQADAEHRRAEQAKIQQIQEQQAKAEQIRTEKLKAEQADAERKRAEQAKLDQIQEQQGKAEQIRAEKVKAEQADAERRRAEQAKLQQIQEQQAKAEQIRTEKVKAEQADAERRQAEQAKLQQIQAKAEQEKTKVAEVGKVKTNQVQVEDVKQEKAEKDSIQAGRVIAEQHTTQIAKEREAEQAKLEQTKVEQPKAELTRKDHMQDRSAKPAAATQPVKSESDKVEQVKTELAKAKAELAKIKEKMRGNTKEGGIKTNVPLNIHKNEDDKSQTRETHQLRDDSDQAKRGVDEYERLREKYGFIDTTSPNRNKTSAAGNVPPNDASETPALALDTVEIINNKKSKDKSSPTGRVTTANTEHKEEVGRFKPTESTESQYVYSESSKEFKLSGSNNLPIDVDKRVNSDIVSDKVKDDEKLEKREALKHADIRESDLTKPPPLDRIPKLTESTVGPGKDQHITPPRLLSHKERAQTKQEILTSKIKAHAEKEISAIKEKGFAVRDGFISKNSIKQFAFVQSNNIRQRPPSQEVSSKHETSGNITLKPPVEPSGTQMQPVKSVSPSSSATLPVKSAATTSQVADQVPKEPMKSNDDVSKPPREAKETEGLLENQKKENQYQVKSIMQNKGKAPENEQNKQETNQDNPAVSSNRLNKKEEDPSLQAESSKPMTTEKAESKRDAVLEDSAAPSLSLVFDQNETPVDDSLQITGIMVTVRERKPPAENSLRNDGTRELDKSPPSSGLDGRKGITTQEVSKVTPKNEAVQNTTAKEDQSKVVMNNHPENSTLETIQTNVSENAAVKRTNLQQEGSAINARPQRGTQLQEPPNEKGASSTVTVLAKNKVLAETQPLLYKQDTTASERKDDADETPKEKSAKTTEENSPQKRQTVPTNENVTAKVENTSNESNRADAKTLMNLDIQPSVMEDMTSGKNPSKSKSIDDTSAPLVEEKRHDSTPLKPFIKTSPPKIQDQSKEAHTGENKEVDDNVHIGSIAIRVLPAVTDKDNLKMVGKHHVTDVVAANEQQQAASNEDRSDKNITEKQMENSVSATSEKTQAETGKPVKVNKSRKLVDESKIRTMMGDYFQVQGVEETENEPHNHTNAEDPSDGVSNRRELPGLLPNKAAIGSESCNEGKCEVFVLDQSLRKTAESSSARVQDENMKRRSRETEDNPPSKQSDGPAERQGHKTEKTEADQASHIRKHHTENQSSSSARDRQSLRNSTKENTGEIKPKPKERVSTIPEISALADYARLKVIVSEDEGNPIQEFPPNKKEGFFPLIQSRHSRRPVFTADPQDFSVREKSFPTKKEVSSKVSKEPPKPLVFPITEKEHQRTGMFKLGDKERQEKMLLDVKANEGVLDTREKHLTNNKSPTSHLNNQRSEDHMSGTDAQRVRQVEPSIHQPNNPPLQATTSSSAVNRRRSNSVSRHQKMLDNSNLHENAQIGEERAGKMRQERVEAQREETKTQQPSRAKQASRIEEEKRAEDMRVKHMIEETRASLAEEERRAAQREEERRARERAAIAIKIKERREKQRQAERRAEEERAGKKEEEMRAKQREEERRKTEIRRVKVEEESRAKLREEEERIRENGEKRRVKQREERAAQEEQQRRAAKEEQQRRAAQEEQQQRRAAQEEQQRRRAAEEEQQRRAAQEEQQRRVAQEEQQRRRAAQEEQQRRRAAEEEQQRRAAQEEQQRRVAQEEQQRRAAQEEQHRRAAQEEQQRRAAQEEQQRRAAQEEQQKRRAAEEEQQRRVAQEEQQRRAAQEEQQRRVAQEEQQRRAAQEEQHQRAAQEEQQQRRVAQEEQQRRAAQEEQQWRAAQEEQQRRAAQEEQQRRAAQEEQQRRAAKEEHEQRRAAEEEQQRRVSQEAQQHRAAQEEQQRRAVPIEEQRRAKQTEEIFTDMEEKRERKQREENAAQILEEERIKQIQEQKIEEQRTQREEDERRAVEKEKMIIKQREEQQAKEERSRLLEKSQAALKEETRVASEQMLAQREDEIRAKEEEITDHREKEKDAQMEEQKRAAQRMDALQYYAITSTEPDRTPSREPFSPSPPQQRHNPAGPGSTEDSGSQTRPHRPHAPASPASSLPRSNTSSPALGAKPSMFRVKDNTIRGSSFTKSVKPRFHKNFGEDFRVGSPMERASERGEEEQEVMRRSAGTPVYPDAGLNRLAAIKESSTFRPHSSQDHSAPLPQHRPYSRRSVALDEDDSRSIVSNMSEDVESYATSGTDLADIRGLYDYERPESACSFSSDVSRSLGKPPTVPPKSEKALRRAQRLTTRRMKKEMSKIAADRPAGVEKSLPEVSSIPASSIEVRSSSRQAVASPHFSSPVSLAHAPTLGSNLPSSSNTEHQSSHRSFYASPHATGPVSLPVASPHATAPVSLPVVSPDAAAPTFHTAAPTTHVPSSPTLHHATHPAPVTQYHVEASYPHSYPLTQRKVLQDLGSGQYFVVDVPVQVKTKTFFDPETGKYVQLNVRESGQSTSQPQPQPQPQPQQTYPQPQLQPQVQVKLQQQNQAPPAGKPFMLYQGNYGYPQNYQHPAINHRSSAPLTLNQDQQPVMESHGYGYPPSETGQNSDGHRYSPEKTPYMDTVNDKDKTVYNTHGSYGSFPECDTNSQLAGSSVCENDNSAHSQCQQRDIITMSELEDFMEVSDW